MKREIPQNTRFFHHSVIPFVSVMSVNDIFRDSVVPSVSFDYPQLTVIRENPYFILLCLVLVLQLVILCKKPVNVIINVECDCSLVKEEPIEIE